jgi:hypothetical protein
MQDSDGWQRLEADQQESLHMIANKISRILNGDPDYIDSWHDIVGYAQLIEDRLALDGFNKFNKALSGTPFPF